MARYEERLAAFQAVDFDDLIVLPAKLLARDAEVRDAWRERLRYILVDEYQDTNGVQYELLKLLAGERGLFTAVGDDDQSIYGWRGATVENLKRLPADYPKLRVIALEQNYRSTGSILRRGQRRHRPQPQALREEALERPRRRRSGRRWSSATTRTTRPSAPSPGSSRCARAARRFATSRSCIAPTTRRASSSRRCARPRIPYKVSGGQSFFDRAEIRDLCAWLRLIVNPDDDPAFLRAATSPKRGIGHQTLAALGSFASRWKASLFEALFAESLVESLPKRSVAGLHEFGRCVNDLQERARDTTGGEDAKALLLGWLKDIGYEEHLHEGADSPAQAARAGTTCSSSSTGSRAAAAATARARPATPRKRPASSPSRRRSR